MSKWRVLVAAVSAVQLLWSALEFLGYIRSVGGWGGSATAAWVYACLGLSGLLVLVVPRLGIPVALAQGVAGLYAVSWLLFGVSLPASMTNPRASSNLLLLPTDFLQSFQILQLLILMTALATAVLCLLSAIGSWQVFRQPRRGT